MTSGGSYVLDTFMSDAPETPSPAPERASRVADGLVELVRRLAAFGRDILGTVQHGNTGFPPMAAIRRFGTINLALIIARITRGLLIAQALEDRLLRRRGPRSNAPTPRQAPDPAQATPRAPRAPRRPMRKPNSSERCHRPRRSPPAFAASRSAP